MSIERPIRYCRCGARLARDNRGRDCGACVHAARAVRRRPPEVPAGVWATDRMRAALASRHMGRVVRAYRHDPFHTPCPLPQEVVGGWLGISQAQLSRVEHGPPMTDLDRLVFWARTLGIPAHLLWFDLPGSAGTRRGRRSIPRACSRAAADSPWAADSTAARNAQPGIA